MKRGMRTILIGICLAVLLAGCGNGAISNDKIKIEQYKGLEVEEVKIPVSEEDIEAAIQTDLLTLEMDVEETVAQMGHIVYIRYEGKKDGVPFEGGTQEYARMVLGESEPFAGMANGIVGHAVGETFDVELTLPEDYGVQELNGQKVVFTITLQEMKKPYGLEELTEEVLPYLSETAKTIEEYKAQVKKGLEESNAESEKQLLEAALWKALVAKCTVKKYPEKRLKEEKDLLSNQYKMEAMMIGMGLDEYLKATNKNVEATAKAKICQEYAVELIGEKEKITVSDKLYKEKLNEYALRDGYGDAKQYEEHCGKENIRRVIIQEKVVELMMDTCVQVEPKKAEK